MKKILGVALIATLSMSNLYAMNNFKSDENWRLDETHGMYMVGNGTSHAVTSLFFVNNEIIVNGVPYKADQVVLSCNGEQQYLIPGSWNKCEIKPHGLADIQVKTKDFHHGAEGVVKSLD